MKPLYCFLNLTESFIRLEAHTTMTGETLVGLTARVVSCRKTAFHRLILNSFHCSQTLLVCRSFEKVRKTRTN